MRLWSIHPQHLDTRGLVALWREALLAQAVLRGETHGYRHHPQLDRFRASGSPVAAISSYLVAVLTESERRGYAFDASKVGRARATERLPVTRGQLEFEWVHLRRKLRARSRVDYQRLLVAARPAVHPLFRPVKGPIAGWER